VIGVWIFFTPLHSKIDWCYNNLAFLFQKNVKKFASLQILKVTW